MASIIIVFLLAVIVGNEQSLTDPSAPAVATPTEQTIPPNPISGATAPAPTTPAPAPAPGPVEQITAREWLLIAKNPDSRTGSRLVVYGEITQFDSATGTTSFRANVDAVVHKPKYGYADYETNTVLSGTGVDLQNVVAGDLFKAEVTVLGSYSYETTLGGTLTVPSLQLTKIEVLGHI